VRLLRDAAPWAIRALGGTPDASVPQGKGDSMMLREVAKGAMLRE